MKLGSLSNKLLVILSVLTMMTLLSSCGDPDYESTPSNKSELTDTNIRYQVPRYSRSQKGVKITRVGNYTYLKTPYSYMKDDTKVTMLKQSLKLLTHKINTLLPDSEYKEEALSTLDASYANFDELVSQLFAHSLNIDHEGATGADILPTALLFYVGGVFTVNTKVGGGGSASIGLVIQPFHVTRIDMISKEQVSYHEYQTAWIGWPNLNLGVGAGGGTRYRVGMGLIWGTLEKPSDFVGPVLAASKTAIANIGINIKAGALHQWGSEKWFQNPFMVVGYEMGAAVSAEVHGNISYVIDVKGIMAGLGFNVDQEKNVILMPTNGSSVRNTVSELAASGLLTNEQPQESDEVETEDSSDSLNAEISDSPRRVTGP